MDEVPSDFLASGSLPSAVSKLRGRTDAEPVARAEDMLAYVI